MEIDKIGIGARLKEFRTAYKLTLKNIAEIAHTSTGYLSDIERGVTKLSIDLAISLYRNHGLNINWLLTGEGSMFINDTTHHNVDHSNTLRSESKIQSKNIKGSNEFDLEKEFEKIRKQMEEIQERVSRSERMPTENARTVVPRRPGYNPSGVKEELVVINKKLVKK